MTKLNNLKEYLDSTLNEEVRPNNLFPKSRITSQFCDGIQYLIDCKEKDVALTVSKAEDLMGANISDQKVDGNTVVQSASTTGAVGAPHYNEWELQKLQTTVVSMEDEIASMKEILEDFVVLHKQVSGATWLPRSKRVSRQNKSKSATKFFQKRLAS